MTHLLVRHNVADFAKWKPVYDAHLPVRQKAGLREKNLLRSVDNPNEVVLLFEAEDLKKAQALYRVIRFARGHAKGRRGSVLPPSYGRARRLPPLDP